ncbi:CatB-related O-acetyltransferase [Cognataquiflexum aquatile]|uniref:CatB-related O-acetyltransferase n=1 Tax=Cognataquiflexum aquatile TaxID=2249427 RepID=UPI0029370EC7|nr:CatB-related O-acetyltransferase [Cognataquiflexum aquatile]
MYSIAKLQNENPNCRFYPGTKISNSVFGKYNVIFNDVLMDSCEIGDHTYIQKRSTIFNAKIGKFCSIASGVTIGPGSHKLDSISTHPIFYLNKTPLVKKFSKSDLYSVSKVTIIENDVWIGEKAIVMDGVKIGTGSVVASGAVVTKDVPPYAIVGGVPAKLIKYRFSDQIIDDLLQSEWWNMPEVELEKKFLSFINIDEFRTIN